MSQMCQFQTFCWALFPCRVEQLRSFTTPDYQAAPRRRVYNRRTPIARLERAFSSMWRRAVPTRFEYREGQMSSVALRD